MPFSPDGKIIITESSDVVRLRQAATGKPITKLPEDVTGVFALSPDGTTLAVKGHTDGCWLWRTKPTG